MERLRLSGCRISIQRLGASNDINEAKHPLRHHLDVSVLNTLDGNTSRTPSMPAALNTHRYATDSLNTAYTANDNGSISGLSNEDVLDHRHPHTRRLHTQHP